MPLTQSDLRALIKTITSEPPELVEACLYRDVGDPAKRPVEILRYDIESAAELVKFDYEGAKDLASKLGLK